MLRVLWNLPYLLGRTPWDTGVTPPELVELVEGGGILPGRALDIGCGTGTNAVYLASHDFEVVGIDAAWLAVRRARSRARRSGVDAHFHTGDIAGFSETPVFARLAPFDLALDVGCFHGLTGSQRRAYAAMLDRSLRGGGSYLLYAWGPRTQAGVSPDEMEALLADSFTLSWTREGEERGSPAYWYRFERLSGGTFHGTE